MKNIFFLSLVIIALTSCGGVSVGVGYHSGDTWPQQPRILQDPPPPDWLDDLRRQYREARLQL